LSRPTMLLTHSSGRRSNCRSDKLGGRNSWPNMILYGSTKLGSHNQVADALSRHEVIATILAIVQVESDMLCRLRQAAGEDTTYKKLVELVREGTIRRYWLEQDLLYAKRG
jgi:hypothetical protein